MAVCPYGKPLQYTDIELLKVDAEKRAVYESHFTIPYRDVSRIKQNIHEIGSAQGINGQGYEVKKIERMNIKDIIDTDNEWILGSDIHRIIQMGNESPLEKEDSEEDEVSYRISDGEEVDPKEMERKADGKLVFKGAPEGARTFDIGEELTPEEIIELENLSDSPGAFLASDFIKVMEKKDREFKERNHLLQKFSMKTKPIRKIKM